MTRERQLLVSDMGGKVRGRDRRRVRTWTTLGGEAAQSRVLRAELLLQAEVRAGQRYAVRVAAHSTRQQKVGSVFANLDVPDFDREPLSMSSVTIGRSAGPIASGDRADWADRVPVTPTTVRDFTTDDDIVTFVRVYADPSSARTLDVKTTLTPVSGHPAFELAQGYDRAELARRQGVVDVVASIRLNGLTAGAYRVKVCAEERDAGVRVCGREVVIRIHGKT